MVVGYVAGVYFDFLVCISTFFVSKYEVGFRESFMRCWENCMPLCVWMGYSANLYCLVYNVSENPLFSVSFLSRWSVYWLEWGIEFSTKSMFSLRSIPPSSCCIIFYTLHYSSCEHVQSFVSWIKGSHMGEENDIGISQI